MSPTLRNEALIRILGSRGDDEPGAAVNLLSDLHVCVAIPSNRPNPGVLGGKVPSNRL
jgi:hypothetical protein